MEYACGRGATDRREYIREWGEDVEGEITKLGGEGTRWFFLEVFILVGLAGQFCKRVDSTGVGDEAWRRSNLLAT